jgi:hypothetical protein
VIQIARQRGDQLQGSPIPSIWPGSGKNGQVDQAPVCDRISIAPWLAQAINGQVRQPFFLNPKKTMNTNNSEWVNQYGMGDEIQNQPNQPNDKNPSQNPW